MKKITCEMCGSTDLIKKDGIFECQSCGTKYSVEEAKKMMVEGKVDVSGSTVKVDDSNKIENYLTMAQNAFDSSNQQEAENYCNRIIEIDANNYRAWLIKGKAAGWQSTIANIRFGEAINCFEKAISNAPEENKNDVKKESIDEIRKLLNALNQLACGHYIDYPSEENANSIINSLALVKDSIDEFKKSTSEDVDFSEDDLKLALDINSAVVTAYSQTIYREYVGDEGHPDKFDFEQFRDRAIAANSLLDMCSLFATSDKQSQITIYKNKLQILEELVKASSFTKEYLSSGGSYWRVEYTLNDVTKQKIVDMIMEAHNKIKELDPTYVIPDRKTIKTKQGCYVATCVYGSYDCPQVWTLRRFRDYKLAQTWYGRIFIKTYYAVSPTIVKLFGETKWFKKIWKEKLDKLVNRLQSEGIKDTPYNDKEW